MKDQIALRKGVIGSERWGKKMRDRVKAGLGISIYDTYGLTEVYGPGIGISCDAEDGMHYWDDYIYIEIVDPATGEPLPDGEWGEIVITTARPQPHHPRPLPLRQPLPAHRRAPGALRRHGQDSRRQRLPPSD